MAPVSTILSSYSNLYESFRTYWGAIALDIEAVDAQIADLVDLNQVIPC